VLKLRQIRKIELAYLLAATAEFGTWVAVLLYAHRQGGTEMVGVAAVVQLLPAALIAPLISAASDRFRRDLPLRSIYLAQAIAHGLVGAAMITNQTLVVTLALATVAATLVASTRPAHGSLIPDLAGHPHEVTAANVVTSTADAVGVLLGPAVAAVILISGSPGHVFWFMAVSMTAAAALTVGVRGQTPPPRPEQPAVRQLAAGVGAMASDGGLRSLVTIGSAYYTVVGAMDVLVVILAVEVLGWGDEGAGALASTVGLGALVGALAATSLVGRRLLRALQLGVLAAAVPLFLLGWVPGAALVLVFVAAVGLQWIDLIVRTLLQRAAPASVLARVLGVHEGLASFSLAVGSITVSLLFSRVGATVTLVVIGSLLPVVVVALRRRLAQIDRSVPLHLTELRLLRQVPMFAHLSPLVLEGLAAELARYETNDDAVVVREGETGDSLYVIAGGEFLVSKGERELARLHAGDVFGEIALLHDVPRTATVRSTGPASYYTLDRHAFLGALGATGEARLAAQGLAARRMDEQAQG
jgi:MFS family permease